LTVASPPLRGLYAITSEALCRQPERLTAAVAAALAGGARLIQYRDKHNAPEVRGHLAGQLLRLCRQRGVPLVINDDLDLAQAVGADGVHVGAADATVEEARARLGPRAIVGRSCHARLDIAQAAERAGASYVALGRFFESRTKPTAPPATLDDLKRALQHLRLAICAIGGLTPHNAAPVIAAGADLVAAVEGVFGADDIEAAARGYSRLFAKAK